MYMHKRNCVRTHTHTHTDNAQLQVGDDDDVIFSAVQRRDDDGDRFVAPSRDAQFKKFGRQGTKTA